MISTGRVRVEACKNTELFARRLFFMIIDDFLVSRCLCLQLVLALLLAPSHTHLVFIFLCLCDSMPLSSSFQLHKGILSSEQRYL